MSCMTHHQKPPFIIAGRSLHTSQVVFVEDCIGEPVEKAVASMANGEVRSEHCARPM